MASGNGLRPQIARIGDYMIEGQLGTGGMGVVYVIAGVCLMKALFDLRRNLSE